MKELKGLETHDFYSRFFVETALMKQDQMNVNKDNVQKLMGIGGEFYTRFNDLSDKFTKENRAEIADWFHTKLSHQLGYTELVPRIYETHGKRGIAIRGIKELVDEEQLWIVEGHFGNSIEEIDPFDEIPQQISLNNLKLEATIDSESNYRKIFNAIFSDEKESCGWAIFLAGEKSYLLEREKWLNKGTYVEVDWAEVFNNKDMTVFKAVMGLFGASAFKVINGEISHNLLAETAHREAHGVTKSLKFSVRDALELLCNEVLYHYEKSPVDAISKKRDENPEEFAKNLSEQGLRYLYRLLFLFYVEARGKDSELLPIKSPSYQLGYSVENLRSLELTRFADSGNGNYIQQTLERTFSLMFEGYDVADYTSIDDEKISELEEDEQDDITTQIYSAGFECPRVGALLFSPKYTPLFEGINLRDQVLQQVIRKLSLSGSGKGRGTKTHRISYANLGLNQLGAVYEGLLSLKPVITDREYYTVLLGTQDEEFLVPSEEKKTFEKNLKLDKFDKPTLHPKGKFLFRTMGYERKYSASFYTDESLTQCLVKEALDEHFKDDNQEPSVEKIENMKILEPAMGSGAFLNEVANQLSSYLAKAYKREKPECKDEDMRALNDVAKDHIMRNCLYGVDLNPMASELAKVSLWLNCVRKGGQSTFHDFKLRTGNSLVGGMIRQKSKILTSVHHFLVPMPQMVDIYLDARELGDKTRVFFSSAQMKYLKEIKASYQEAELHESHLKDIAGIIEEHYLVHTKKRENFQNILKDTELTESEIAKEYQKYIDNNGEFHKINIIMDYWCSLWFWNPEQIDKYPTMNEFIEDIDAVLKMKIGKHSEIGNLIHGNRKLSRVAISRNVVREVPFFHYDLEYPEVFKNGGFDLVIGNPPWAKLAWSDTDYIFDLMPELHFKKLSAKDKMSVFAKILEGNSSIRKGYQHSMVLANGIRSYISDTGIYPYNDRSEANTYKYFWQRYHSLSKEGATYALIKQGGITSDKGMDDIRPTYYCELSRLYRFINERILFEVDHHVGYVLSVFCAGKKSVDFRLIDNLYHPITISRCLKASKHDEYPGKKDSTGAFNLMGHPDRIINIADEDLKELVNLEGGNKADYLKVSLPSIYGKPEWKLLKMAIEAKTHLGDVEFNWSAMFHETADFKKGYIETWTKPHKDIADAVLTGPNIFVGTPFYKQPNLGCKNNLDYSMIDLNQVDDAFFPATKYIKTKSGHDVFRSKFTAESDYRICARAFVGSSSMRTLSSAIYPSCVSTINRVVSFYLNDTRETVFLNACLNSLIFDFYSRTLAKSELSKTFWSKLPLFSSKNRIGDFLVGINLRLNCITDHYAKLWEECWNESMETIPSIEDFAPESPNSILNSKWASNFPIRGIVQREQALCAIDVLVAMFMGVNCEELVKLYRSQFGVLQKNLKDLPGQLEPDSFPRAMIMEKAYNMFLDHFKVTEEDVINGCFQEN